MGGDARAMPMMMHGFVGLSPNAVSVNSCGPQGRPSAIAT